MPQRNLVILLTAATVAYACYVRGDHNPYVRYVANGLAAIEQDGLDRVPDRELFNGAMHGMVDVLRHRGDEHSQFLAEEEADPLRDDIRQQFGGIGVRIRLLGDPPQLTIVGPPDPGTPAARANLLPGDHILAIDDLPATGMPLADALRHIRGQPGSTLRLSVQHAHEEQPRTVELVREVISIDSVLGDVHGADGKWQFRLADDPRIALIRITSFGDRTAEELGQVLDQLVAEGVQAAVLDLRDNAGGPLDAAVAVCDMFLPAGKTVVEIRGRDQKPRHIYSTSGKARFPTLPLALIVNQNSASAAEIVAACLQDHERAVVVGERSYGKGTVQQLIPLESGKSLLKLTWASFWRPSGANIHRMPGATDGDQWGVSPNQGYEQRLSPDEYADYRRWRAARDMQGLADEIGADENAASAKQADRPTDNFADKQLQSAVQYLQSVLDRPAA